MAKTSKTNKQSSKKTTEKPEAAQTDTAPKVTPEVLDQIAQVRTAVQATFGQVAMSMMSLPRYKHVPLGDLQVLLLEPLVRDRIAIAQLPENQSPDDGQPSGPVGAIIWAKVSDAVHDKISEQVKAAVFPVRLEPADWASGERVWILDVIAPTQELTRRVLASAGKLVGGDGVNIHPIVTRLVGRDVLEKMGAKPAEEEG